MGTARGSVVLRRIRNTGMLSMQLFRIRMSVLILHKRYLMEVFKFHVLQSRRIWLLI